MKKNSRKSIASTLVALLLSLQTTALAGRPFHSARFETIIKHFNSGHTERKNYVITNEQDWSNLWNVAFPYSASRPALPRVDFTRRMVVAVFQGVQPSSDYDISISKVVKKGTKLKVHVKESIPGPACYVRWVLTQPFHIIEVDNAGVEEIQFSTVQKIRDCQQ